MNDAARIDLHQHLIPPEFREALEHHGMGGWASFEWSEAGALATMDKFGIATGMLSLSTPGPHLANDAEVRELARRINERLAGMVKDCPERCGMFASVPLPDVDGSLETIAYDHLSPDGIVPLASTQGIYLGDPTLEPVMEKLDRRSAVVLVHPAHLDGRPVAGLHPSLADFLLDTTRAAMNLVLHGVPRRYPDIRFIPSHAGGFLPYAAHRIAMLAAVVDPDATIEDLSSFYFDTALSSSPTVLPILTASASPGRVLFGSDGSYASSETIGYFTANLDKYEGLDAAAHAAINRSDADTLSPRLAALRS